MLHVYIQKESMKCLYQLQVVSPPDLVQSRCLLTLFMSAHLRLGSVQQLQTQGRGERETQGWETEGEGRGKVRGGQEGRGKTIKGK